LYERVRIHALGGASLAPESSRPSLVAAMDTHASLAAAQKLDGDFLVAVRLVELDEFRDHDEELLEESIRGIGLSGQSRNVRIRDVPHFGLGVPRAMDSVLSSHRSPPGVAWIVRDLRR